MRSLNRWSTSCLWMAAMVVVWFAFVPTVLSMSSWAVATLGGPIVLVAASALWEASRPVPSVRQLRAERESAEAATGGRI